MPKYKITRIEFYKGKWAIYFSIVDGACYCSMHDRTGLTDQQVTGDYDKKNGHQHAYFRRAHYREVSRLVQEQREKRNSVILN